MVGNAIKKSILVETYLVVIRDVEKSEGKDFSLDQLVTYQAETHATALIYVLDYIRNECCTTRHSGWYGKVDYLVINQVKEAKELLLEIRTHYEELGDEIDDIEESDYIRVLNHFEGSILNNLAMDRVVFSIQKKSFYTNV